MTTLVPEIGARSVADSIAFYQALFDAKLVDSVPDDSGGLTWAEIDLGGSRLMFEEVNALAGEFGGVEASEVSRFCGCLVVRVAGVEDARKIRSRAASKGVDLAMNWKESEYGTVEFGFRDPDGNLLIVAARVTRD